MDNKDWDVIVVGAGPVGAYLSSCLVEKGYNVLILEKKGVTGRQICAGVIGVEAFTSFSLPVESIVSEVTSIAMYSPSGKTLRHTSKGPMAYVVDRVAFDQALLSRALDKGAEFINLSQVLSVERVGGKMEVVCKRLDDEHNVRSFKASLVVLATGYAPRLLASLGFPGYPGAVVGVQMLAFMKDVKEVEVHLGRKVAPGGFAWLVPVKDGKVRVGLVVEDQALSRFHQFMRHSEVASRLVEELGPVSAARIPRGPISKTYKDGLIVVGEAAGQVKATTYGGVYYGLLCAKAALVAVEDAFDKGDFGEKALARYQDIWLGIIGDELRIGAGLRREVESLEDEDLDNLFVFLGSDGLLPRLRAAVKFDWHKDAIRLLTQHLVKKGTAKGESREILKGWLTKLCGSN